jgi:pimeloyl-ACP methyl ester carboxylesterase
MTFLTPSGLTEEGTSHTIDLQDLRVHYHDIGEGEPILFLHSYGPGTTAWLTFHKVVDDFAVNHRCILMDLPNFGKSGPIVIEGSVHSFQARVATQLLDALGIESAFWIGNSQGGRAGMAAAINHPSRVRKFVLGGSHIGSGHGDPYLLANRPSEGSRASGAVVADPSKENFRRYLNVYLDNPELVTDELVDYVHHWHTWSPEMAAARRESRTSVHDYSEELSSIQAESMIVWGRSDRMVVLEVGLNMFNQLPRSRFLVLSGCGHWPPFEKPREYTTQVLAFIDEQS